VDRPVVVAGDSAGGNLAAICSQGELALLADIAGQLLCYPVVDSDLTRRSYATVPDEFPLGGGIIDWYWRQYLPDPAARFDPRASPLRSQELDTAAPAVIVLPGQDPLLDEGRAYAAALDEAGVRVATLEYPGAVHGFLGFPGEFSVRDRALAEACAALSELVFENAR
jgi:acetyl esterase